MHQGSLQTTRWRLDLFAERLATFKNLVITFERVSSKLATIILGNLILLLAEALVKSQAVECGKNLMTIQ
jgi:hypothetical protein